MNWASVRLKKHGTHQVSWRDDSNKIERERGTLAESFSDMIAFLTWMERRQMADRKTWIREAICYSHYLQYKSFFQHIQLLTSPLWFVADILSLPTLTNKRSLRQKVMTYISVAFTDRMALNITAWQRRDSWLHFSFLASSVLIDNMLYF